MSEILVPAKPQAGGGSGGGGFEEKDFGDYGGGPPPGTSRRIYRTGMWLALLAISMLYFAFTSAYIVRSGLSDDWQSIELPRLLWWNALVLFLSSLTMERTRSALNSGLRAECNRWLAVTTALGIAFLAGQLVVWRQLVSHGVYLTT